MNDFGTFLVVLVGLFIYFLPTFVGRKKRNAGAICALNILLGWTLIGWIVALVWATTEDPEARHIATGPKVDKLDRLQKLRDLHIGGAIDTVEYVKEKDKILKEP